MIAKITQKHLKVCYGISNKMAALKTAKLSSRVKQKQTVQDVHNLQEFLTTQISENKLNQTIKRTSKYDDGFAEFLNEYKKKNKNVLDLTHYATSPLNKSQQLREEEYRELKAFLDQRKQQYKMMFEENEEEQAEEEEEEEVRNVEEEEQQSDESDQESNGLTLAEENNFKVNRTGFEIDDTFYTILLDRDTNTQVTTLQRINTFRQLVFMGNGNGIVGYGQGKGKDFESAFRRAMSDAKRNLVPISLDLWLTCPVKLEGKFYDTSIQITPRPLGFNSYGNPQLASMILLSGIHHCGFKARSRNQRPYALLYAYMQAVTSNTSPDEISEAYGCKVYRQNWGKKISRLAPLTLEGI